MLSFHVLRFTKLEILYQSRTSDEAVDRPLQVRYEQKMAKYGAIAEQNNLRFVPAIVSHTGQIHAEFKALIKEQIRQKLICFEGEAKSSKVRSGMNWWSRCISMTIAKTASRNVAFKVTRMREAIMENQSELLMQKLDTDEIGLEGEKQVDLDDVGINADLYIFNQVSIHD